MSLTTKEATEYFFKLSQRAPFNIAPEQGDKLKSEIFGSGKWSISPSETAVNFYAVPSEATIYLSYAGLANLWCLAYAAFHVMDIASRRQRLERADEQKTIDIGDHYAELQLGEYISYARALFHSDSTWPSNISRPKTAPLPNSNDDRINNIFFGALSWIMLHEIAHVHHKDEKLIPSDQSIRQEYRADDFATSWILNYAGQGLQREFRVLMISVALTWLFLNEAELGQASTHPAAILRFREVAQQFQMGKRSVGLENAAYLFKAVLDPYTIPPSVETPEELFYWISNRLEQIFPAN